MYGQAAGLAALGAIYPPALLIAAAYLSSGNPRRLAGLFLAGAVLTTVVAGVVILIALRAGGLSLNTNKPPRYGLRVGLGALALVAAAYLIWRYRHPRSAAKAKAAKPAKPGRISRMTTHPRPLTALVVGLVLFSPGVGFIGAVQVIATAKESVPTTVAALALVVVITLAFAWLPLLLYVVAPERTTRVLKSINEWLSVKGKAVLIGALGAVGVILLIDGLIGLTLHRRAFLKGAAWPSKARFRCADASS
jgi:MFS family permease